MNKISLLFLLMLFLALPGGLTQAQARYDWMPNGGCEILMSLNRGDLLEIVTAERTGVDSSMEEWKQVEITFGKWQKFFADTDLAEKQAKTLAAYLANFMPVPKDGLPQNPKEITCSHLHLDSHQLVIKYCQDCHGLKTPLQNESTVVGWLNLFAGPALGEDTEATAKDQEAMAYYLWINNPVPDELIPESQWEPPQP